MLGLRRVPPAHPSCARRFHSRAAFGVKDTVLGPLVILKLSCLMIDVWNIRLDVKYWLWCYKSLHQWRPTVHSMEPTAVISIHGTSGGDVRPRSMLIGYVRRDDASARPTSYDTYSEVCGTISHVKLTLSLSMHGLWVSLPNGSERLRRSP